VELIRARSFPGASYPSPIDSYVIVALDDLP
jgi:hypothetical protein